ncbi:hypothetical protein, partial [Escherichia coli]|uniref:hypothetical protein n=1 Tax=Escherichia coli TaxID=562 RepID=UPI003862C7DD
IPLGKGADCVDSIRREVPIESTQIDPLLNDTPLDRARLVDDRPAMKIAVRLHLEALPRHGIEEIVVLAGELREARNI